MTASLGMEAEALEQRRWLVWFGLPMVGVAFFVGLTFATGWDWMLGPAIVLIVFDITVIVYLAMTSDTNGGGLSPSPSDSHH